jgi:hypothetical protein
MIKFKNMIKKLGDHKLSNENIAIIFGGRREGKNPVISVQTKDAQTIYTNCGIMQLYHSKYDFFYKSR